LDVVKMVSWELSFGSPKVNIWQAVLKFALKRQGPMPACSGQLLSALKYLLTCSTQSY
jgi:hypothetical protein